MGTKIDRPAAIAILAIAVGCARPNRSAEVDVDQYPGPSPAPIAMQGIVAPALVGAWKYPLGSYTLASDGKYDVHFDYKRPAGPGQPDAHVVGDDRGTWSADADCVYFKSSKGNVIQNKYRLSPDKSKMELYPKFVKVPDVLLRQK